MFLILLFQVGCGGGDISVAAEACELARSDAEMIGKEHGETCSAENGSYPAELTAEAVERCEDTDGGMVVSAKSDKSSPCISEFHDEYQRCYDEAYPTAYADAFMAAACE